MWVWRPEPDVRRGGRCWQGDLGRKGRAWEGKEEPAKDERPEDGCFIAADLGEREASSPSDAGPTCPALRS